MSIEIIFGNITEIKADAIVNAANERLQAGGGVCGAIFKSAGIHKLQEECNKIGHCETGNAVITSAYNLPSKYIIHAVGPVWTGGTNNEEALLYDCYQNSISLAIEYNCLSIAFPVISAGIFGYPKEAALKIALLAISNSLLSHKIAVSLVIFDKEIFDLTEKILLDIQSLY